MYGDTVARYAELSKAAGDLKRAVGMIEAWTAKAEDARLRLLALEGNPQTTGEAVQLNTDTEPVPAIQE
jgi:hypothetical protein